jgi:hypothetical protein
VSGQEKFPILDFPIEFIAVFLADLLQFDDGGFQGERRGLPRNLTEDFRVRADA